MFVTIFLTDVKKKLVVPFKWVHSLDILQLLNGCHVRSKIYTIFYSNNLEIEPDFGMPISEIFDEDNPGCYQAQIGNFFDEYDDAVNFMEDRRGIRAALYNANLKRYIFDEYDQRLARQNVANMPNEPDDDEEIAGTSEPINNGSEQGQNLVKIEPTLHLYDGELIDLFDDSEISIQNGESHEHRSSTPFDDNDFIHIGDTSSVGAIGNDDSIQNAVHSSPLLDENANNSFEEKEKVRFLNLTDEVLEISGDEFDALREELAYGSDNEDSFAELVKEFDNLVENGIQLPAPIKEELNDVDEQSANVPNLNENPTNDVANNFDPDNIGELSSNDRIRAEYANCQVENNTDPVLGNMPRFVNELKNRWVFKQNIEVKNITYSLLEFYNCLSEVNPKFYDEKFARIMCTSFIGTEKVAKSFEYNPKHEVVLFMKDLFNVRVGGDERRAIWFDCFIKKYIEKTKSRLALKTEN